MPAPERVAHGNVLALGLSISHSILRDGVKIGLITRSQTGHYDAVPSGSERFDLPESQRLFGADIDLIAMRLHRIGYTVVPEDSDISY